MLLDYFFSYHQFIHLLCRVAINCEKFTETLVKMSKYEFVACLKDYLTSTLVQSFSNVFGFVDQWGKGVVLCEHSVRACVQLHLCKRRACAPAAHLNGTLEDVRFSRFCGPVANLSQPASGPWPKGWGPLH